VEAMRRFRQSSIDLLLQASPDLNKSLLGFVNVMYTGQVVVHPMLNNTSDLVVHMVEVWTVRRQVVGFNEVVRLLQQQLDRFDCVMCRRFVLLESVFYTCTSRNNYVYCK
jgi:hypothetical protein